MKIGCFATALLVLLYSLLYRMLYRSHFSRCVHARRRSAVSVGTGQVRRAVAGVFEIGREHGSADQIRVTGIGADRGQALAWGILLAISSHAPARNNSDRLQEYALQAWP